MELFIQERLKDLRVERGLTLEQLAEQTHLSKSAFGSYEGDKFRTIFSVSRRTTHWKISYNHRGNRQPGQRPGTGGDGVYLQAAQIELQEVVRGRKEVTETDCTEVGLAEKSKAKTR